MKFWLKASVIAFLRGGMVISGKWYQMLASRFVTDTNQLGQKCTTWNFSHLSGNEWNIHEHGHLHYLIGFDQDKDYRVWTKIRDEKFLIQDGNIVSTDLWIRNKTDNVLMLMGLDNLTFYVLSRDPEQFDRKDRSPVMDLLQLWEYDTWYKTPVSTYELSCEE